MLGAKFKIVSPSLVFVVSLRNFPLKFISFPECLEKKFEECLDIINADLQNLGLSTVEIVVHEKRNINQEVS